MSGNEDQKQADQADQIIMILVKGLFDQENINETEAEQDRTKSVHQAKQQTDSQRPQSVKMQMHSGVWPWPDPFEAEVSEYNKVTLTMLADVEINGEVLKENLIIKELSK